MCVGCRRLVLSMVAGRKVAGCKKWAVRDVKRFEAGRADRSLTFMVPLAARGMCVWAGLDL